HARCNARADRAAIATSFCGGRGTQATRSQHGGGRKREYRLLHRSSLQVRSAAPTADSGSKLPSPRAELETDAICRKFVGRRPAPLVQNSRGASRTGVFFFIVLFCPFGLCPTPSRARGKSPTPTRPRLVAGPSTNRRIRNMRDRQRSPGHIRNRGR